MVGGCPTTIAGQGRATLSRDPRRRKSFFRIAAGILFAPSVPLAGMLPGGPGGEAGAYYGWRPFSRASRHRG
jgi:hypothetical protein